MTGKLLYNCNSIEKHKHLTIILDGVKSLEYIDPRRFGLVELFTGDTEKTIEEIKKSFKIGLDPIKEVITEEKLATLYNRKTVIKKLLMDNSLVCGIGNIYACEILFDARINPNTLGKDLNKNEIKSLKKSMLYILNMAISEGGSSINDYVKADGTKGRMQEKYKVYGKNKESCSFCGTSISKITQFGRSTYFCPECQKLG